MIDIPFFDSVKKYDELGSTFVEAKRLISSKQAEGNFLLIADKQTEGVGRKGNSWFSPNGGLWITAGIYNLPIKSSITIFTALMIVRAIIKLYPDTEDYIGIKWPNDIFIDGKKMGGILTSNFPMFKYLLLGIGLNTNNPIPDELKAASLLATIKDVSLSHNYEKIDHESLLRSIFETFGDNLPTLIEQGLEDFLEDYYHYSILENKEITIHTEFEDYQGIVSGLNKEGALMVKLDNEMTQPFLSGSVIKWS